MTGFVQELPCEPGMSQADYFMGELRGTELRGAQTIYDQVFIQYEQILIDCVKYDENTCPFSPGTSISQNKKINAKLRGGGAVALGQRGGGGGAPGG
jgi:hypothetical protein